jgi:stress response protein YsnF
MEMIVMSDPERSEASIPLVQERVVIEKHVVETGRVRIRSVVDEKLFRVAEELERDDVSIERVEVNREVTTLPQTREEDGVLIVPIIEEVVVLQKRLILKEELRIHRNRKRERLDHAVRLKSMRAEVERVPAPPAESGPEREPTRGSVARSSGLRRKERLSNPRK